MPQAHLKGWSRKNTVIAVFSDGRPSVGVAGTMRRSVNVCCRITTAVLGIVAVTMLGTPENARGQVAAPQADARAVMPDNAPPSQAIASTAFVRVEEWFRAGEVPADAEAKRHDELHEFPGVSIWVRSQGRVIARASLMTPPGEKIPDVLQRVARGVLDQVGRSFEPAKFPGVDKREWIKAALGGCTITMECAGAMVPFRADTYDDVDLGVSPGVWGLASAVGEGFDAIFPLHAMSSGMTPGAALRSTIARASNDPGLPLPGVPQGAPGAIAKSHGAVYYRFRTTQVTRVEPGEPVTILTRGGVVVSKATLTQQAMLEFTDHLAVHVLDRLVVRAPGEGEAVGVVELGDVGQRIDAAGQRGPAIVALHALGLYTRALGSEGPVGARASKQLSLAAGVLTSEMKRAIKDGEMPPEPIEASLVAAWLATRTEVTSDASAKPVAQFLASGVRVAYDAAKDEFDAKLPEPVRGLVALALVRLSAWEGSAVTRDEASKCVRKAFQTVTPGNLSAQLPWLGWAEIELAGAKTIPAAIAFESMRDELYAQSVNAFEAGDDDADLAGGMLGIAGGVLPTWHTARPGCFLATMLGDARLTRESARMKELGRLLDVVRYTRQLAVDEHVLPLYADKSAGVMWGVRSAMFDLRQPGDATSFSLMLMAETMRSIGAISPAKQAPAKAP